jgi:hypothetical protein
VVALPFTISNGDAPNASPIQSNFSTLASAINALRNANVAADAGIESRKLAQNYSPFLVVVPLLPASQGADLSSPGNYGPFATSFGDIIGRFRVPVPNGRNLRLVSVDWYAMAVSGSPAIEVRLLVDGAVVGQAVPIDSSGTHFSIVNSNPYQSELRDIADLTEFQPQIRQASSGSGTCRGLTMTLAFKAELTS